MGKALERTVKVTGKEMWSACVVVPFERETTITVASPIRPWRCSDLRGGKQMQRVFFFEYSTRQNRPPRA
jgi:hypothetical protein